MAIFQQPGDTIFQEELWWVMVLDANHPGQAQMQERYYLSEGGVEGCRRVLQDVQRGSCIPMLAITLEQMEGILQRFEHSQALDEVLDAGEGREDAWLVWMDKGGNDGVQEVWTYTRDPSEAERRASELLPGALPLLRASLATMRQAQGTLRRILHGYWTPVWLDLRDFPRHLAPADLLERKQLEMDQQ